MPIIFKNNFNMTLVPPCHCSKRIKLDIRAAIMNDCRPARKSDVAIYLDKSERMLGGAIYVAGVGLYRQAQDIRG